MQEGRITFYRVLLYIAYAFYILMGATWFIISFMGSGHFNLQAFMLVAVFSVQAWYKHALTNLILGILSLALSIFMLLQVLADGNLFAKGVVVDALSKSLMGFGCFSIAMSLVLIFSYVKYGFKER